MFERFFTVTLLYKNCFLINTLHKIVNSDHFHWGDEIESTSQYRKYLHTLVYVQSMPLPPTKQRTFWSFGHILLHYRFIGSSNVLIIQIHDLYIYAYIYASLVFIYSWAWKVPTQSWKILKLRTTSTTTTIRIVLTPGRKATAGRMLQDRDSNQVYN